jgi:hypothetical protein
MLYRGERFNFIFFFGYFLSYNVHVEEKSLEVVKVVHKRSENKLGNFHMIVLKKIIGRMFKCASNTRIIKSFGWNTINIAKGLGFGKIFLLKDKIKQKKKI